MYKYKKKLLYSSATNTLQSGFFMKVKHCICSSGADSNVHLGFLWLKDWAIDAPPVNKDVDRKQCGSSRSLGRSLGRTSSLLRGRKVPRCCEAWGSSTGRRLKEGVRAIEPRPDSSSCPGAACKSSCQKRWAGSHWCCLWTHNAITVCQSCRCSYDRPMWSH